MAEPDRPGRQPLALEVDAAVRLQLERVARARRQPPEALAGELLALALHREAQRARAEASLADLTPRQREVAGLAARGYTNLRIAEALVVSPETVKTHMRHVLEKLGLRAKSQLQFLLDPAQFERVTPPEGANPPPASRHPLSTSASERTRRA